MNPKNTEGTEICNSLGSFITQNGKGDRENLKAQWNSSGHITKEIQNIKKKENSLETKRPEKYYVQSIL